MSQYRLVSNFRVLELVIAIGLIAILNMLAFEEYSDYIQNSYALNFILEIQDAKTNAAVDIAFTGIDASDEHKIVYSKVGNENSVFQNVIVDNRGKVTLKTPDRNSDSWHVQQMEDDFLAREISMYIHQTGTQAYGFLSLSCDQSPQKHYSEHTSHGIKKLEKVYYQYSCPKTK